MTKFVYQPEGVEAREWEFDPDSMSSDEGELIERYTDWTFGEWKKMLERESVRAQKALLFVYLRRDNSTLKWESVQFSQAEIGTRWEEHELRGLAKRLDTQMRAGGREQLTGDQLALLFALQEEHPDWGADDLMADTDPEEPADPAAEAEPAPKESASTPDA